MPRGIAETAALRDADASGSGSRCSARHGQNGTGSVIGRKNHYGSRSKRGTEVAALFYSLIESAKLCGVEPKAYLLRALRAALATPGTVTLPHTLAP